MCSDVDVHIGVDIDTFTPEYELEPEAFVLFCAAFRKEFVMFHVTQNHNM